jgi:Na+-driven multidrug efflux pump
MNNSQDTAPDSLPENGNNEGISLLMGDPKKAIVKLSGPMIVAMFLMSTYNIVNAIWVAGLGSDALAAVGFVTPLS